ncbi:uncharacterized protein LAESUDRAFT_645108 [Laetiporus sulphureus 93-53]|uniref:Uncharacterized protein n=1 Tax=Laetiporus sulphureus 93-53 TaxID=1314785 RepID=A0A165GHN9_9APHY|nr:uncharacterized protein LAESUDRAFT_645108 [Laetiporus sulphureus 93-53]KZT10362.1 hypothetical protein LAESUDRAFT_645108 [Laetiporus sulphureus 93-53]
MVVRPPCYRNTHVIPIFVSLLCANILQAIASMMDLQWLMDGAVEAGRFCGAQGGLKNGGNVASAVWSAALSVHVFMLLFLRRGMTNRTCIVLIASGWIFVGFVVAIGPLAIQKAEESSYFGPSGYWCWITHEYPEEQMLLEYFFEFLSAACSIILYTAIVLRVRGNLIIANDKWRLRFVPHGERWLLSVSRDYTDNAMMSVAARMVWHPIAYTICLLPVAVARFISFDLRAVPFWVTIFADFIFNMQGFVNVVLVMCTRHLIPDTTMLPMFVPRKVIDFSSSEAYGITPFTLPQPAAEVPEGQEKNLPDVPSHTQLECIEVHSTNADLTRNESTRSGSSISSVDSRMPLFQRWKRRFSFRRA